MRGMDWTYLAQDRDKRRAVVDTVMNLPIPLNTKISRPAEELLDSQEGLYSVLVG
jgi:hypothetical protein